MTLRTFGDIPGATERPLRLFRLLAVLPGAVVLLLTALAGSTGAGVANYQSTLYLDGAASSISGSSWQITSSAGPGTPTTPITVAVPGGGTLAAASYQYIYVRSSGNGRTASSVSTPPVAVAANGAVNVSVSPAELGGDLYRARAASGVVLGNYVLASPPGGVATVPYTDTGAISGAALPQADNRILPNNTTGWTEFAPGVGLAGTLSTSSVTGSPVLPGGCKGWVVDGSGGMSFPGTAWTFQVRVKAGSTLAGNGLAVLSAGMWKVNDSGSTVGGYLIAPTDGDVITNATGMAANATVTANPGAFTLGPSEHLCIQFWRHQTLGYTGGSAANHSITLLPFDPANQITVHPAPNGFASASLSTPADGLHTTTIPQLSATYSDPEGDAGTLTIKVCTDSGCSTSPENSGAMAATDGATLNWTPTGPFTDGTYWWEAQGQDALGLPSAWTSARTFMIDNVAPTTSITASPPAQSNAASGSFSFSANESVTGYQCRVDGSSFAACTSPAAYGPLADGAHSFGVKAVADLAGNPGTTTNYGWAIDTVPPNTSITSQPAALSNSASPSFDLSATEGGSTFECSLDGTAFGACPNPKSYSSVADGAHLFQARAVDPAGNVDPTPASYAWTIDATPPDTTIGPSSPAALTIATGASFDFSSNESPSTFQCALDAGAYASCSSPKTYSGLADGSHIFYVRARDTAANTDPSAASYTWTIDTTPPTTTIGPTMPAANTQSSSATFDLGSNEPGSTFECRLDGALFAACTTPASYAALGDGTHTFDVRATDPAGNLDTSPASYSWKIDNVAPSTPTLTAPADALTTNGLPQLRATFADGTAGGDSGTVEFQLCSSSASAGASCAPVAQSVTSGLVSNGGTASATPAALVDGTHHWQARAVDVAGNQSGWSATRSFQLDTSLPVVTLGAPADGAWVNGLELSATFSKPAFAGTGSVDFRVCSDALCLGTVQSGNSGTLVNGALAKWSPSFLPVDGLYYWQARSRDSAGNFSAWTAVRTLHLDTVAPGKPPTFTGVVAADGLTLRWSAPNDNVANYVVFVNGAPWKNLGSTEFEVKMGTFDPGDTRSFSVVAVDLSGNVGAMSPVLVGVPNLVGLTWSQALGAANARGLALQRSAVFFASIPMIVANQLPPAPALTERGTAVFVTMSPTSGAPLGVKVKPGRFACAAGSVLRLRVDLSAAARVRSRLLNGHGRVVKRGQLGILQSGTNNIRVKLPGGLRRGAYRLMLDATGEGGTAHALVRVKVGSHACRAR